MSTSVFPRSTEMQRTWDDLIQQMCTFVSDTNADLNVAYDWVCEMLDIDSFVDNNRAWDSFYFAWESAYNGDNKWGARVPTM